MKKQKLFGTSGIRGIFGEKVTVELASSVGLALGKQIKKGTVLVGRDPRETSFALENALISGLESAGIEVLKAGIVPTPVLAYSVKANELKAGAMITASHNPPEYNGIKLWQSNSMAFDSKLEEKIEEIVEKKEFSRADWKKIRHSKKVKLMDNYVSDVKKQVKIKNRFKIAVDCGGGANSVISPLVLSKYSHGLIKISCEFNGAFSERKSEPSEENLKALAKSVWEEKADIGFAHDGDGDRLAVIDDIGRFVEKDILLALLAKNELESGGVVVVPVDTSKLVWDIVEAEGGEVVMSKVGDVCVAEKLEKKKGVFGGEPSGCFIFPEFSLCPDGILASLKVLELMDNEDKRLSEMIDELPKYETIRKKIKCEEKDKEKTVKKYSERIKKLKGVKKTTSIDGTRVDFEDAWALVRASGTESIIRITVEAKEEKRAKEILKKIIK